MTSLISFLISLSAHCVWRWWRVRPEQLLRCVPSVLNAQLLVVSTLTPEAHSSPQIHRWSNAHDLVRFHFISFATLLVWLGLVQAWNWSFLQPTWRMAQQNVNLQPYNPRWMKLPHSQRSKDCRNGTFRRIACLSCFWKKRHQFLRCEDRCVVLVAVSSN